MGLTAQTQRPAAQFIERLSQWGLGLAIRWGRCITTPIRFRVLGLGTPLPGALPHALAPMGFACAAVFPRLAMFCCPPVLITETILAMGPSCLTMIPSRVALVTSCLTVVRQEGPMAR